MDMIGYLAAFCTTLAFFPQTVKVIRTRDTSAISTIMYLLFTVGVTLWLVYGVLLANTAIILANGLTLFLALIILSIVLYNDFKRRGQS